MDSKTNVQTRLITSMLTLDDTMRRSKEQCYPEVISNLFPLRT